MLGSSVLGGNSGSPTKNRVFVYEVTGLRQSENNDSNNYQFRSSSSVFISVPYSRMNEQMQRIGKMGGTIVKIQSLEAFKQQKQNNSSEENKATSHKNKKVTQDDQD
ncbi:MAG: photosystem I reaction center subunit XII [Pleurocapsa sp. SU_5_0]|nr:photosystem I reaction center subunit XII [Pleurocapsa sp. SU_5_0]